MELITTRENILLAYRNIKKNKGSMTKGTDARDITFYSNMPQDVFVNTSNNVPELPSEKCKKSRNSKTKWKNETARNTMHGRQNRTTMY